MPKLSPDVRLDRRANIISAARRCFARHGIHVSVDEICAEAGVSKGALYGYFESKQAIIEAIADEHGVDIETVRFAPDLEGLKSILAESINHGDSVRCRLELEAWTHSLGNEPLRTRLLDNTRHLREAIASALDAMKDREMLRLRVEPAVAAEIVTCFAFGAIASSALAAPASGSTVDAALDSLFDLVVEEPGQNLTS